MVSEPHNLVAEAPVAGTARPVGKVRRDPVVRRLLAGADLVAITLGLCAATALAVDSETSGVAWLGWGLLTLPFWILIFKAYGLYDRDGKRVSHSTVDDVPWLFHALVIGSLGLWAWYRWGPLDPLILRQGVAFFVAALVGLFLARGIARRIAYATVPAERLLLVGGGPMAAALVGKIRQHPEYALAPVGYLDAEPCSELDAAVPYLGEPARLREICRRNGVDRVLVVAPAVADGDVEELIRDVNGLDIRISVLPQLVDVLGPSVEVDDVEGITILGLNPPALTPSSRFLKRSLDIAISSLVLVLVLPVIALAAVAIKVTSAGPVFFRQDRIGRGGRRFRIVKLRTMVADAERQAAALQAQSDDPSWLLLADDPRITRVGRLLRRSSIDELPQLWNVL